MSTIPKKSLTHNKFKYLGDQETHAWLVGTDVPRLPNWLQEIPLERIRGPYISFNNLYRISYDSDLTKTEQDHVWLDLLWNKFIRANTVENLSAGEIIDKIAKYKKIANKHYEGRYCGGCPGLRWWWWRWWQKTWSCRWYTCWEALSNSTYLYWGFERYHIHRWRG